MIRKITLAENEIPDKWYNIVADMPNKPAVAQAYYNKQEGVKKITIETGAGQWGNALSFACQHFGIDCEVLW
jgi:predicted alternative tryptophan synthase beta-subunit